MAKPPMSRATFNKTAAINYAKKYATSPNTSYNYYAGADCTNFASQILNNGGISTNSDWKKYTSYWINAHSFGVYWYSRCSSKSVYISFNSLSANLAAGDFIVVDWNNDGKYDHIAFVTASGSKTSSGYYDVTIAQHSGNYCQKVSGSSNKWENTSGLYMRYRFN